MSDILELVFNVIVFLLETLGEFGLGNILWPDTKASRLFWGVIIVLLGVLIWQEVR